jgi:large subunit ribosomal protein L24
MATKSLKARKAGDKSGFVTKEAPIDVSNVMIVCPTCGKATRVRHDVIDGKKVRVCAKCGKDLGAKPETNKKTAKRAGKKAKAQ